MLRIAFLSGLTLALVAGCGDYAMNRGVLVQQIVTTTNPSDKFDLDTSEIPSAWIQDRIVEHHAWGDLVRIQIVPEHRVKVVLIPLQQAATTVHAPNR